MSTPSVVATILEVVILLLGSGDGAKDEIACGQTISGFLQSQGLPYGIDVPWNALVIPRDRPEETSIGILISSTLVLAKAHKFLAYNNNEFQIFPFSRYSVILGSRSFGTPAEVSRHTVTSNITHIRVHPLFKPEGSDRWLEFGNFALLHLTHPVVLSKNVSPICMPDSDDEKFIHRLQHASEDQQEEELILTGQNRDITANIFLWLKIQDEETCVDFWQDHIKRPYDNRWCAIVGNRKQNDLSICIHRDIGAVRLINGSYFLSGIPSTSFSVNETRICGPGDFYFFESITSETLGWIEDNLKCGPNNYTCSNGECIHLSGLCDQIQNCSDGSDEKDEFCRGQNYCPKDEFPCVDKEDEMDETKGSLVTFVTVGVSLALMFFLILPLAIFWYRHLALKKNLTDEEVKAFHAGILPNDTNDYVTDPIQRLPWNPEDEIGSEEIEILEEINRGSFGIVNKARLLKSRGKFPVNTIVAAKKPLPSAGAKEFKALLCELKIHSCLGPHQHIVTFLGASTTNLKKRDLYMVVEYYANGNLRNFMRANAQYFLDLREAQHPMLSRAGPDNSHVHIINTFHLLVWAVQIACGMEFLSSRNVVHRDLAARNVLVSSTLDVILSDFGSSREYGVGGIYAKCSKDYVPWRWLPIEALRRESVYSQKTDVWAYGVTLWEIFSLGDIPHRTAKWDRKFMNDLRAGVRLPQPKNAGDEVYRLMKHCWQKEQVDRPPFSALKNSFESILRDRNYSTEGICDHLGTCPEYLEMSE